jgi:hypothetical protein
MLDATAGSSIFMGCKGCVLTLPRAKIAARRLPGASCGVQVYRSNVQARLTKKIKKQIFMLHAAVF